MTKNDSSDPSLDPKATAKALNALLSQLPVDPVAAAKSLSKTQRSRLRIAVRELLKNLETLHVALDPIRQPAAVLDPSDPKVVGQLIARTLLAQPLTPLAGIKKFYGSGVYAVYYHGHFDAYQPVSKTDTPLYIGKVDPQSPGAETPEEQGVGLYNRLIGDHARSIRQVENLDLEDFDCRYLVVKSAWQNTAETYLIDRFKPIWNNEVKICYGIGKHGDAASTRGNTRSPWDTLHPGRTWAWKPGNIRNPLSPKEIKDKIAEHYRKNPPDKKVNGGLPPSLE